MSNIVDLSYLGSRINCIYRDDEGRMWIGSEKGLSIYDPNEPIFELELLPKPTAKSDCTINDVYTNSSFQYLASNCGLYYRAITDKEFLLIPVDDQGESLRITKIFQSRKGIIYLGTNKTLYTWDLQLKKLRRITEYKPPVGVNFSDIESSYISDIIEYPLSGDTLLWVSVYGHVIVGISDNLMAASLLPFQGFGRFYEHLNRKFFIDKDRSLWICGALKGILKVIPPANINFEDILNRPIDYSTEDKFFSSIKTG